MMSVKKRVVISQKEENLNRVKSIEVNNMDIKKVIMINGNEYHLIWDIGRVDSNFYNMIDIKKGWVKLNRKAISEELKEGKLKDNILNPKIKSAVLEYYGEHIFLE